MSKVIAMDWKAEGIESAQLKATVIERKDIGNHAISISKENAKELMIELNKAITEMSKKEYCVTMRVEHEVTANVTAKDIHEAEKIALNDFSLYDIQDDIPDNVDVENIEEIQ